MSAFGSRLLRLRSLVVGAVEDLRRPAAAPDLSGRVLLLALALMVGFGLFNQLAVPLRASYSARVTADEPFYLLTTVSLLEDSDLDLRNDYELGRYWRFWDHEDDLWYQSVPTADGRILSPHNVGTSVLIAPAFALGRLDGAKGFLAVLGGVTIGLAFLLAFRASGELWSSLGAAVLLGVSAPLFIYSAQIYPEGPGALLVTLAAWLILGRRLDWLTGCILAVLLVMLAWLGVKYAFVGAVLAGLAFVRLTPGGRVALVALTLPAAVQYAWFHLQTYGGLTPYAVNLIYAGSDSLELLSAHIDTWNRFYRFIGLWVDGEFGLIRWAPVLLLALLGLPAWLKRPGPARWLGLVFGMQLLVAVFLSITMRGWWFPGRMLILVLPLLVLPLASGLSLGRARPWLLAVAGLLGAYTLGITLALRADVALRLNALAVDPFLLDWPPFQAVGGLFPVYTSYELVTWLLTGLWVLIGAGIVWAGLRLVRSLQTGLEHVPGHVARPPTGISAKEPR